MMGAGNEGPGRGWAGGDGYRETGGHTNGAARARRDAERSANESMDFQGSAGAVDS